MKIFNRSVAEIKPYDKNPRINEGAVDAVAMSIKEFGFRQPIVVDADDDRQSSSLVIVEKNSFLPEFHFKNSVLGSKVFKDSNKAENAKERRRFETRRR